MDSRLALVLCLIFIAYFIRQDLKGAFRGGSGLWLPSMFLVVVAGRAPSLWLNPNGVEGGRWGDTVINAGFVVGGVAAYIWKDKSERAVIPVSLLLYLAFCGVSLTWSEGGIHAFKQYIKLVGMVVMGLLVVSEADQVHALTKVFRRAAYVLIPVSLLFIKYYPHLGVRYDEWSGRPVFVGVADSKNMLGQLCMATSLVLFASLVIRVKREWRTQSRTPIFLETGLLLLALYLLFAFTDSVTATICLIAATSVLMLLSFPLARRHIGVCLLSGALLVGFLQLTVDFSSVVAEAFDRDPTLTNRTLIWDELLNHHAVNPLIGTGFEGFWTPVRRASIHEVFEIGIAHNGFLEIYLHLGIVGLLIFIGVIVSMYKNSRADLETSDSFGRMALPIWVAVILYNFAESGWRGLSVVLFLSIILAAERTANRVSCTESASANLEAARSLCRRRKRDDFSGLIRGGKSERRKPAFGAESEIQ